MRTRLSRVVAPPFSHHTMWWACVNLVVGLREPAGPAAREAALPVPVAELTEHPGGRLPKDPPHADRIARDVLDHHLHAGGARKAPGGLGGDHRAALDLGTLPARDKGI